jgi:hypothetical protein
MQDLITTTGHGGTVYMIIKTIKKVLEETPVESCGKIGVIGGAGSIGWSTTVAILEMVAGHAVHSYDKRFIELRQLATFSNKISVAPSAKDVLDETNIIVAAVTEHIDLDRDEFMDLDLTGKVIIDDSQPGSFDREQVEARGGKLLWVVGEDGSSSRFITRDGLHTGGIPYNYGNAAGLHGDASEFACGQEAAVVAKYHAYDQAISGPVTPEDVRKIGRLFEQASVQVAPFQAYGKPGIIS